MIPEEEVVILATIVDEARQFARNQQVVLAYGHLLTGRGRALAALGRSEPWAQPLLDCWEAALQQQITGGRR
jgi:hypothetical protein